MNRSDNRLCVIGVYFGTLPNYFNLWLKSAAHNNFVDFIIFTDNKLVDLPENVYQFDMTLEEMKKRADKVLGFDTSLYKPYKCCDFKVIYGLIFDDYIEQYDYWAHTDFDLIYGDFKKFLDEYDLYQYDRFLPLGHLSFYRNTEESNHHFMAPANIRFDYKRVYSSGRSFAFDETPGTVAIYLQNNFSFFTKKIFLDISDIYHRYVQGTLIIRDEPVKNYELQTFYWEDGRIYRVYVNEGKIRKEEYMYMHFKKRPNYMVEFDTKNTNAFYLTNNGFIPKKGETTIEDIRRLNPYPGERYEKKELRRYNVKKKFDDYYDAVKRRIGLAPN